MRKVCYGPMQFSPYRPWSPERRAAASARERSRIAGEKMLESEAKTEPEPKSIQETILELEDEKRMLETRLAEINAEWEATACPVCQGEGGSYEYCGEDYSGAWLQCTDCDGKGTRPDAPTSLAGDT